MARLDENAAWLSACALLDNPAGCVAAIADTGLFVELPDGLPGERPLLAGKSALDVAAAADREAVIVAWERTRASGSASVLVRTRDPQHGATAVLHFIDLRARIGVYLCVLVPSEEPVDRPAEPVPVEGVNAPPRLARVYKDQTAVFVEVDDATTALLGWSREEMVGRRSLEFIHPDDRDLAVASWMEVLGAPGMGRRVRLRHVRKDGTYAWFEITNYNHLEDAERACVAAEIVDISEEMAAHEQVRAREQLLQRLAEALPVGVVQLTAHGDVVYVNSQLEQMLGVRAQGLADIVVTVVDRDRESAAAAFAAVLAGEDAAVAEVQLPGADQRYCSITVRRLDDGAGTTTGAVACLTDITDGTRLRQELRRRVTVDPLTDLLNRAGISEALDQRWDAPGRGIGVLFIDLDGFKGVNDELGHETGDRLLATVADALREGCRTSDEIGRLGGDEFLVVCGDVDERQAKRVRERVRSALGSAFLATDAGCVPVLASVGLAWTTADAGTPAELVAQADQAMYANKARREAGRAATAVPVQGSARP